MAETEGITINLSVDDPGTIDLLIELGGGNSHPNKTLMLEFSVAEWNDTLIKNAYKLGYERGMKSRSIELK